MSKRLALSVAEAATALGVGKNTVYRLIREERLRSVKLGTRTVIPVDAVNALLDASAQ